MLDKYLSLARRSMTKALHLLFITGLLTIALGTVPVQSSRAEPAGPTGSVSPEGLLNPDGTLDLSTGFQGALDLDGWEVILDEGRGPVLTPTSSAPVASVTAWNALPNQGLNGDVRALAVVGSDLYVGGQFTQTVDGALTNLGYIARYDTETDVWNALLNQGLNSTVYALAVDGSDLYVGGQFTQTNDGTLTSLGYIARYDTTDGDWHTLPRQGMSGTVYALAVSGGDLYVGGNFSQSGDGTLTNLGYIARYDTAADTWHALPNQGLNSVLLSLAVDGSDLYVGGQFTQTGDGALVSLGRIARYDTATGDWHALPNQGLNSTVYALAVDGGDLYVGGTFTQTGNGTLTNLGYIARYDTTGDAWHELPDQGLNNTVHALTVDGSDLYVGGQFTQTGDASLISLGCIVRYDTTSGDWHTLPNQGLNDEIYALSVDGNDLYVGGGFVQTGDGSLTDLGHIARYDTTAVTWHTLPNRGLNLAVLALAAVGSDLYVGGQFTQTGDGSLTDLGYIARYDTVTGTWHALPNQGLNDVVQALLVDGSDLYVGGWFTQSGDGMLTNLGYIIRYDTTGGVWHALPDQGLNDQVYALAVDGSDLYVGGIFAQTGDGTLTNLGCIARYDTTSVTWHALPNQGLGDEFSTAVHALAVDGSDLYVGGIFTQTGDGTVENLGRIARYDTTAVTWHALPNQGLGDEIATAVYALAVNGSDLYVGGIFTQTGDGTLTSLGNIARYDTTAGNWHALSNQGLNGVIFALAVSGRNLYVGGIFIQTGDGTLTNLVCIGIYDTVTGDWHALPNQGLNRPVGALAVDGTDLYVGGDFTQTHDGTLTNLGHIVRYAPYPNRVYLSLVMRNH